MNFTVKTNERYKNENEIYSKIQLIFDNKVIGELYYYFILDNSEIVIEYLRNYDSKEHPKVVMKYLKSLMKEMFENNIISSNTIISLSVLYNKLIPNQKLINYYLTYKFNIDEDDKEDKITYMSVKIKDFIDFDE